MRCRTYPLSVDEEVTSEFVPTRRLLTRSASKGETMSYKTMRLANIAVPSLSIALAACSLEQAPDEESGDTVTADRQTVDLQAPSGLVFGGETFAETCVNKNISLPACSSLVGQPCSPQGLTVTCKRFTDLCPRPDPDVAPYTINIGVFDITCQ